MNAWESVQNALNYIEGHYEEDINIDTLSAVSHLSKFYFQRLFYKLVNKNVSEYIKLRRLAIASKLLKERDEGILDIALKCGFKSHSSFSSAFKEVYGITPDYYRKSDVHLDVFVKPDLSLNYTITDIGVPLISDQMVLEISERYLDEDVKFSGKSRTASVQQLGKPKVNMLVGLWDSLKMDKTERSVGVDILTPYKDPGYFNYFVGVESVSEDNYMEIRIMPKGKYIVCTYEAENFDLLVNEALYKASRYMYDIWLPNHRLEPEDILIQKYFNPFRKDCYIELWAKVKAF